MTSCGTCKKRGERARFDRQITIQQPATAQDTYGQPLTTWSNVATGVWCNRRSPTGMGVISAELQAGGTQVSRVQYSYRIGWRRGLTAAMRVVDGDMILEIKQVVLDLEAQQHVDLVCVLGANEG
jgi:SPP1 family predicted phage head-tail adaptor